MRISEIPGVSNVAAGATFTIECPVGRTYNRIALEVTNITSSQLTNLTVEVNGKAIQTFADLAELKAINDYYTRDDDSANGVYWLYFTRPELLEGQRKLPGLGTKDVATLVIRGDLAGAVVSPAIKCHAVYEDGQPLGLITKVKRFPVSLTAGVNEIDKLPRGPRICAIHLFKSDITDVEVEADGVKIYDASKTIGESVQQMEARTPQTASATHVDFMSDGDFKDALVTAGLQDFRVRPTATGAGVVNVVVEYLDGFAGI